MLKGIEEILEETITVILQFVFLNIHYKYVYSSSAKSN